jgi:flagellar protein FlbD
MILLTRLSGSELALNADLIERIDSTPDTVITLVDGTKYVVAEPLAAVVTAVRLHHAEVAALSRHLRVEDLLDGLAVDNPDDPADAGRLVRKNRPPRTRPNTLAVVGQPGPDRGQP